MSDGGVSLIVPNRDMSGFLADAFGSIARQRRPVQEILVVDSGAEGDSAAVAADWRARGLPIRVLAAPGANPAQARNTALAQARGRILGFLDGDDLFPAGKLELQLARLEGAPRVDMVSGAITWFEQLDPVTLAPAAGSRTETRAGVQLGACLIRREVFDRIGVLDESLHYSEDTDFVLRILEARLPVSVLRQEVLYYRRHPDSMMSQPDARKQRDFHRTLARSLRRRAALGIQGNLPRLEDLMEAGPDAIGRGA
jgi:glycosyltransferase involved in cell wall biosynthesis